MLIRDFILALSLYFRRGSQFSIATHLKPISSISLSSTSSAYFNFSTFLTERIFEHFESVSVIYIIFVKHDISPCQCRLHIKSKFKKRTKAEIHKSSYQVSYQLSWYTKQFAVIKNNDLLTKIQIFNLMLFIF